MEVVNSRRQEKKKKSDKEEKTNWKYLVIPCAKDLFQTILRLAMQTE